MKINFVNADHVHALVDLPASRAIDEIAQLLKGSSSHWVNESNLVPGKFAWQRGYGAFSVSHSAVAEVAKYIANQEAHHKKKSFVEELKQLVERYGLEWHKEETVETVSLPGVASPPTRLKPGVNEIPVSSGRLVMGLFIFHLFAHSHAAENRMFPRASGMNRRQPRSINWS